MENTDFPLPTLGTHALVFGGSGAIGFSIMRALAAHGVKKISFTFHSRPNAANEAAEVLRQAGVECVIGCPNLLSGVEVHDFLDNAIRAIGEEVSMVVHAGGISPNMDFDAWTVEGKHQLRHVFDANVFGPFVSTRVALERMEEKGIKGSAVITTSTNAINSFATYSVGYDMSKGALGPMVSDFALRYAPAGIRVNGIAPGWIATGMNDSLPPGEYEKEQAKIWLGQSSLPVAHVANPVVFLLSSGADGITGQNIIVDGGYR